MDGRRDTMRDQRVTAIGLVGLMILTGCSAMHERRWGYCALAGGLAGAAVGAGTAGGLVNAYEGGHGGSHQETGAAAGAGAVGGGLLGALLGHVICDPQQETPPPPPPPAPPPPPVKQHPEVRATVEGHTDSVGSEAYNQRLSERRANAVRDYLVAHGIDASRITTRGYGKTKP